MHRIIEKKSFFSEIIVSELVALNCLYKGDNNFSSSVDVLRNKLKYLHSTNIDFFQLNYAQRDEQIW